MRHKPDQGFKPAMAQQTIEETITRNASAYPRFFFRDEGIGRKEYCGGSDHGGQVPIGEGSLEAGQFAPILAKRVKLPIGVVLAYDCSSSAQPSRTSEGRSSRLILAWLLRRGLW
jgi:hypothetical protein